MQRVVITGFGIVSCLGNEQESVLNKLRSGMSGIKHNSVYEEMGFKSCVSAKPEDLEKQISDIDRKLKRFLSVASTYGYIAALDAVKSAGLTLEKVAENPRVGVVAGSGGASTANVVLAADNLRDKGLRAVGATMVPKTMSSTVTAALSTGLKIHGVNYSISSACATSAHCIGHAMELIQLGKQDIVIAGGAEEEHWSQSSLFDAMGAMASKYNDVPDTASRPYSKDRDGFVIAGGAGMVVVESLEHAVSRNAPILAEIVGYGATSDGESMVAPSGKGAQRCMQMALKQADVDSVDYINTHGTATKLGDIMELEAIKAIFGNDCPAISSTKSMTGHSLGAAGVQELIYCLLMMQHDFVAPSINITELDEQAQGFDIVRQARNQKLDTVMSNSFGFGGTNATLLVKRYSA